jgi:hypothetical protein
MRNQLEDLGIDAQCIESDAKFSVGVGRYYVTEAKTAANSKDGDTATKYMAAATAFRRAACHYLLLDEPDKARKLFALSANAYSSSGNPYAYLIAALSNGEADLPSAERYLRRLNDRREDLSEGSGEEEVLPRFTPNAIFAAFDLARQPEYRAEQYQAEDWSLPQAQRLEAKRAHGLGTLGLPLNTYLNIAQFAVRIPTTSASEYEQNGRSDLFESLREQAPRVLSPLLSTYSEALSRAQQNSYHWKRLAMPFHPAEPDILGALVLLREPLGQINVSLSDIFRRVPISDKSQGVLESLSDVYLR